jgi:protein-L-isoaspartate(D-aspartate) O-methyltransferase
MCASKLLLLAPFLAAAQPDPYLATRRAMVQEQIVARGVREPRVIEAMRAVPRHLFMPDDVRPLAYDDRPARIGYGQTISQPYIVAYMTELLAPGADSIVLEIGTGSGYQAAVLSLVAKHVCSIEIVPELAAAAAARLKTLGYANISVRLGDGYKGWPERAPFDRIILTAAPPEVPQALIAQLKPGGRLVAPVGASVVAQRLVLIEKDRRGRVTRRDLDPVMFVPMVRGGAAR